MNQKCTLCGTWMEIWSEPDMDGTVSTFALCPKCGFEIGLDDVPVTQQEWSRPQ